MKTNSGLKASMKIQLSWLIFITCTLIILFSIVGCSDSSTPYTGSMLTSVDVTEYLTSNSGGIYCIHNDINSSCIDLVPLISNGADGKGPIIHIYPEKTLYLFYHEGKRIVRAERVGDTTAIIETLRDKDGNLPHEQPMSPGDTDNNLNDTNAKDDDDSAGNDPNNRNDNGGDGNSDDSAGNDPNNRNDNGNGDNSDDSDGNDPNNRNDDGSGDNSEDSAGNDPNNINDNGDGNNPKETDDDKEDTSDKVDPTNNSNDGHGWLLWIYYPEGTEPINAPTLSESEVTITINGKQLSDDDITGFAQFIDANGEKGIQFFYPTDSAELLNLNVQMNGLTVTDGTIKFNINYLWNSY